MTLGGFGVTWRFPLVQLESWLCGFFVKYLNYLLFAVKFSRYSWYLEGEP